jgi:predicted SnoaL-like aldol condensation-catalyzing enzyme
VVHPSPQTIDIDAYTGEDPMAQDNARPSSRKESAVSFLRLVVAGQIREAYGAYVSPEMRHHNVAFAGDAASLEKAMQDSHDQHPHKILDVTLAIEEGDLVAVYSHVRFDPAAPGFALVHIFRYNGNRIVEMWDIAQPVPEQSPNLNGMF